MSRPTTDRMMHPGFDLLVTPTKDWPASAEPEDAFAWVAYGARDRDGMADVRRGFAPTRAQAADAARTAFVPSAVSGAAS